MNTKAFRTNKSGLIRKKGAYIYISHYFVVINQIQGHYLIINLRANSISLLIICTHYLSDIDDHSLEEGQYKS